MTASPAVYANGTLQVLIQDQVAVLRIDRPQKLNALNHELRAALTECILTYGTGQAVNGIVVTGTGRAFSAGKDLAEEIGENIQESLDEFNDMTRAVLRSQVPTVAAINGIAVGGVAEFTLCFDSRIGSPESEYMFPESRIGLPISNASSFLLPRLVGQREAHRLLLESPRLAAPEALSLGLLDELVASEGLLDRAVKRAAAWGGLSVSSGPTLQLLRPPHADVEAAFQREIAVAKTLWTSSHDR